MYKKKECALDEALSEAPPSNATTTVKDEYEKHINESNEVNFETLGAIDMANQLKEMFQEQARQERSDTIKSFMGCKVHEGAITSVHVLKTKSYIG
uniref:Uncharacterized protein n=1 Tax=Lactuca sativa TaxID=4236 RepID=A0A9R1VNS5_LACSA|nr:hypothetical protein LSAT_V11C400225080 [Lactuca sativa]